MISLRRWEQEMRNTSHSCKVQFCTGACYPYIVIIVDSSLEIKQLLTVGTHQKKKPQAPHHLADALPSASAGETQARHFGSDTDGVEVPLRTIKGNQYGEVHIGMAYFYGTLKV